MPQTIHQSCRCNQDR